MMHDLINDPVFFISEELEKERVRYYNRLNGVRGDNPDWYSWIDFFLSASQRMADHLLQKLENIDQLAKDGLNIINDSHTAINQIWLYTFSKSYCIANDVSVNKNFPNRSFLIDREKALRSRSIEEKNSSLC